MNDTFKVEVQEKLSQWLKEKCHNDEFCEKELRAMLKNNSTIRIKINNSFKSIFINPKNAALEIREIKLLILDFIESKGLIFAKCENCTSYNLTTPLKMSKDRCYNCNEELEKIKINDTIRVYGKCLYCGKDVMIQGEITCNNCRRYSAYGPWT